MIYLFFLLLGNKLKDSIKVSIALPIGTFISGFTFLTSASFLVGLPGEFTQLVIAIVVPAAILNLLIGIVLYRIVIRSLAINKLEI